MPPDTGGGQILASPVVAHRGPRLGMADGDLDIPEVDSGVAPTS